MVEYLNYETLEASEEFEEVHVPFIDTSARSNESPLCITEIKSPSDLIIKKRNELVEELVHCDSSLPPEPTFDGCWSSDEENENNKETSDVEDSIPSKQSSPQKRKSKSRKTESRKHFWNHKEKSLQGKIACKYCETVFRDKVGLTAHICKYLQCDPKNFICRVCNKELSRKTFSNHLHETLDCQFCGKKFVNPRNMKTHLRMQHNFTEKLLPAKRDSKTDEGENIALEERTRKPRKKEKLECGKRKITNRNCKI